MTLNAGESPVPSTTALSVPKKPPATGPWPPNDPTRRTPPSPLSVGAGPKAGRTTSGARWGRDVGADDEIDSDVDPVTGRSEPFAYSAITVSRSHDAGLRPSVLFLDGFESGDTSAWSATVE
jgi:hypothetical protein